MSKPDIRALADMDLEQAPSPVTREELRVFIVQEAFDRLVEHGNEKTSVEVGGVLVGRPLTDERGPYVVVDDVIRADHSRQEVTELTFTHDTWDHINKEMDEQHEGRKIVGWYHTHPGFGLFLSEQDLFIQRSFFDLPFQLALVYDPLSREHGCFAWRGGEPWRLRRYWVGEAPYLWDGDRPRGAPPRKEKEGKEQGKEEGKEQEQETAREARGDGEGPRGAEDEEGIPGFVFTIIVALLALAIGGAGGYFYSARRMAVHEQRLQQSLTLAKAEGAVDTVRLLRSDLLSAVEDALNREKLWRPLAGVRDRLKKTLNKVTPEAPRVDGTSAKISPTTRRTPAALGADLDAARAGMKAAVDDLARLQMERIKVQALVGALQRDAVAGAREVAGIARETTLLRAGLGQVYAELARQAMARGEAAEAQRLLTTAAAVDPAGRDRYTKALQKKATPEKKQKK